MAQPLVSDQDWNEWLQHPVTEALNQWALRQKELLKEAWASGQFTDQSQFGTAIANAKAIGNCEAFDALVNLEYSQLIGDLTDEERVRTKALGEGSAS